MDIADLRRRLELDIASIKTEAELRALRDRYLARKNGLISNLLKEVASAPADQRPALGKEANLLKKHVEDAIDGKAAVLGKPHTGTSTDVDVTLPGREPLVGHLH
ncbi:MAG TPA: phenylalanine--tRNA ligase subunit alpha, partial [Gammaproteobacteria bacterium]|nr:phenylalanine--tRNA ligase subunit alpha [Gammaproteobacteria bacterium]